jgi:hypothetical protein
LRRRGDGRRRLIPAECELLLGRRPAEEWLRRQTIAEKQKYGYASCMNNSALPRRPRPHAPLPAPLNAREGRAKNSSPKTPCNPLKSLDSNERIQGTPRESNRHNRDFSQQNSQPPTKPKSRLTNLAAAAETEPSRLRPNANRPTTQPRDRQATRPPPSA